MLITDGKHRAIGLDIVTGGYQLPRETGRIHWLFRYLHVLGAAVVFGVLFHYFYDSSEREREQHNLLDWIIGGLLYQIVIGVLSMPRCRSVRS